MWGNKELVELIKKVNATGGLDLDLESICNYQDAIGHSTPEELHDLATNKQTSEAFYRVYQAAAGTINTIRFYFENSNAVNELRERNMDLETEIEDLQHNYETMKNSRNHWMTCYDEKSKELSEIENKKNEALLKASQLEEENIRLKAKLYDLMNK